MIRITSIDVSPKDDKIISSSKDNTTRIWNISEKKMQMVFVNSCSAIFNNSGTLVAVGSSKLINSNSNGNNFINIYDLRSSQEKPVFNFCEGPSNILGMKYSNNGQYILCMSSDKIMVFETIGGCLIYSFNIYSDSYTDKCLEASFSPDSKYIVNCTGQNGVEFHSLLELKLIKSYEGKHAKKVLCTKFSQKHMIVASSCQNLILWRPDLN